MSIEALIGKKRWILKKEPYLVFRPRVVPKSPAVLKARKEFAERMRKKSKGEVSDVFIYALPLVLLGIIALKRIVG